MSTATLDPSPVAPSLSPKIAKAVAREKISAAEFDRVRAALSAWRAEPARENTALELRAALRAASAIIAGLPRQHFDAPVAAAARELIREVSISGIHDAPVAAGDLEMVSRVSAQGWPGLLAAMMLVPAWQWPAAPALDAVPDRLWGDYTAWSFAAPQRFTAPGQADVYVVQFERRLGELARWVERNPGAAAVRTALETYLTRAKFTCLYSSSASLRRHAELHARLLTRSVHKDVGSNEHFASLRDARRLRVGFVLDRFDAAAASLATLPLLGQLDAERFEIECFVLHATEAASDQYARQRVAKFHVLPADVSSQLSALWAAGLDVAVFASPLAGATGGVARIAAHRVAPLQVATSATNLSSTGFPDIDLFVAGAATGLAAAATEQFSERLALVPGPVRAFNHELTAEAAVLQVARGDLGLPERAIVLVAAADFAAISPATLQSWARLLAAIPQSCLLVHPGSADGAAGCSAGRFCAEFDHVLAAHGVVGERLVVSTSPLATRADLKEFLRVGDIFLDPSPSAGDDALVAALELGLPVVAHEGEMLRARVGAALLRSLGFDELIVSDEAGYHAVVARLATDSAHRAALAARIQHAMASLPAVLDPLAASDAFGDILERAYDELAEVGAGQFRADRTPLVASDGATDCEELLQSGASALAAGDALAAATQARAVLRSAPSLSAGRALLGRALLAAGQPARAVDYLLAAVQRDGEAASWFDLSRALRKNNQGPEALQALETSLRLDPANLEGWLTLVESAEASGALEIATEALGVARELAPADARVAAFDARLKAA